MKGVRLERVQEEIRREIGAILQHRTRDPRLAWVTVTRVEVSADLMHARVHVSALGDERALRDAIRALGKAGPFIRSELGRGLKLRRVPEVQFLPDEGIRYSIHMSQLLHDLEVDSGSVSDEDSAAKGRDADERTSGSNAEPDNSSDESSGASDASSAAGEVSSEIDDEIGGNDAWTR